MGYAQSFALVSVLFPAGGNMSLRRILKRASGLLILGICMQFATVLAKGGLSAQTAPKTGDSSGMSAVAMPQEANAQSTNAPASPPSQSTKPTAEQDSATASASGQSTNPKAPATATNPQSVAPPMPKNDSYWDPDWGPRRTFKAGKAAPQFTGSYQLGSVFVSDGSGSVDIFQPDGTMVGTLSTGQPLSAGMAFDRSGNLYVTTFGLPTGVVEFDVNGNLVGPFGSFPASATGNSFPESVLFSTSGNVFVGAATFEYVCPETTSGPEPAFEFSPSGSLLNTFTVTGECRGTDWIELLPDQMTLLYTSEGTTVKSFNIGTNTQNANFAVNLPGSSAFAFRQLPDGTVLVADSSVAVRLGTDGTLLTTYLPSPAPTSLFALNLDPDDTSFWTADLETGTVYRFDIASATQLSTFVSPTAFASGLAVFGEKLVGNNNLTVTVSGTGAGTVTSTPAGISCPTTCLAPFPDDSSVTLTAMATAGSTLASFSLNCVPASPQTTPPSCTVPIVTSDVTVTATFGQSAPGTILISPLTMPFGFEGLGSTSSPETLIVSNTGNTTVTFTSIAMSGDFAGATLSQCPSIAAGSAACTFHITFTPTAAGVRNGTITFTDNATGSPQTVTLTGTGVAVAIGISPTSLTFGSQVVGTTSAAQAVTVSNNGNFPLIFSSIVMSGDFAGATLAQCPSIGEENPPCVFSITFKPMAAGVRSGTITFTDTGTGSPQTVTLTGTGTPGAATVTVTPSSLTFGSQALTTTSAPLSVTVMNTSTGPVNFAGFTTSGADAEDFGVPLPNSSSGCSPTGTLAAGATCTINVLFTPQAAGARTATLLIADNATGSPQTVALSGTGVTSQVIIAIAPGGSSTATTVSGGTAFYGLTITGAPGVTGTVQLGCVPSSVLITCKVIPSSVTLTGGTTEVAFAIQTFCQGTTTATGFVAPIVGGIRGALGLLLVSLVFGGAMWTFRRNRRVALTFATLMLVALGSAACSNSLPQGPNGATPAGTYTLSLTTTLNGQTQTLNNFLTLVVK
jgi:Abnormal spindle-like microcephaly-assoc'd, ASPM-SPD-2-Hydin